METPESRAWQLWRQKRHTELAAPDSWLGVRGLFWLAPGNNTVGNTPDATVPMPDGPALMGHILWEEDRIIWRQNDKQAITIDGNAPFESGDLPGILQAPLHSDRVGAGSQIDVDRWRLSIIERDGRISVRIKNLEWASERRFTGVEAFPFSPAWVITARWQALGEPSVIDVPTVTGDLKSVAVTHQACFEHRGKIIQLLPMSAGPEGVFLVFRDANSPRLCYGGGRFLRAPPPAADQLLLDFNRAFNPPCAFTPFATCPLPPAQNWLDFPIDAGERRYMETAR